MSLYNVHNCVINELKNKKKMSNPIILLNRIDSLNRDIFFFWMPSHIGIAGIEWIHQQETSTIKKYLRSPKYQNPIYVFTGAPTKQPDIRDRLRRGSRQNRRKIPKPPRHLTFWGSLRHRAINLTHFLRRGKGKWPPVAWSWY